MKIELYVPTVLDPVIVDLPCSMGFPYPEVLIVEQLSDDSFSGKMTQTYRALPSEQVDTHTYHACKLFLAINLAQSGVYYRDSILVSQFMTASEFEIWKQKYL